MIIAIRILLEIGFFLEEVVSIHAKIYIARAVDDTLKTFDNPVSSKSIVEVNIGNRLTMKASLSTKHIGLFIYKNLTTTLRGNVPTAKSTTETYLSTIKNCPIIGWGVIPLERKVRQLLYKNIMPILPN